MMKLHILVCAENLRN